MLIRRGDIFYADLRPVVGSEQGGVRPVLIIQNDVGNRHSPTVICAAITSQMNKAKLPTHVELDCTKYALVKDSAPTINAVEKSMTDSTAYVTASTEGGGQMQYKLSMVRDLIGWKVSNVELYFPSQN